MEKLDSQGKYRDTEIQRYRDTEILSISDMQEMVKEHENAVVETRGTEGLQLKEKKASTM